ncbi:HAD-IB family hydrolase [Streptomyces sp. NPDC057798]|uniref:HAD-IB family hydrolase n=1 Tax=Streptomyces sp. NPDC057798 TaxID=3346252 RepID=UPI0036D15AE2
MTGLTVTTRQPSASETLRNLLADIAAAPAGPSVAAYFDFDGTLIRGHSAAAFCRNRARHGEWPREAWHALTSAHPIAIARDLLRARAGVETHAAARLGAAAGVSWHGRPLEQLNAFGERVYREDIAPRIVRETWLLARAHQARGHRVCIATAASAAQVRSFADALGVDDVLCTPVHTKNGTVDGHIPVRLCAGVDKLAAVRRHATAHGVDLAHSFAYCDSHDDVPLLAAVGRSRVVAPRPSLAAEARRRDWPVLQPSATPPLPLALAATAAASATAGGFLISALVGARSTVPTRTVRRGSRLVLRAAGVHVAVTRAATRPDSGPCVYVVNHTSPLDALVVAQVLPDDWCALIKAEVAHTPLLGHFLHRAGNLFVDRGDRRQAAAVIDLSVSRLEKGTSVIVMPEGTRSRTPDPGPFRPGAFRIAARAKVPVVPVVLHNVADICGRSGRLIRPGCVHVSVLPAVNSSGWSEEDAPRHAETTRELFVRALLAGPTSHPVPIPDAPPGRSTATPSEEP